MVLKALSLAGGKHYLAYQAEQNPAAFMAMVGKVLPHTIVGTGTDGAIEIKLVKFGETQPKRLCALWRHLQEGQAI